MAPKSRPVTARALQALLTRIGSASSGTKDVLYQRFERDVVRPRLPAQHGQQSIRGKETKSKDLRIMSIDMGIKNLAYCDASVKYSSGDAMSPTMDIIRWDKLNLVDAARDLSGKLPNTNTTEEGADEDTNPYSLSVLSETAYQFITKSVLSGSPDIILIERQRWRSASSAAIQQWTVRVNTLEAMLWAALKTILIETRLNSPKSKGHNGRQEYEICGVDPKRVGQYWLSQHARAVAERQGVSPSEIGIEELAEEDGDKPSSKKIPRTRAEKKAKIALLRSWLSTEPASTASSMPDSVPTIAFTISPGAAAARQALSSAKAAKPRKTRSKGTRGGTQLAGEDDALEKDMKKLDDITDCFLQAAAWVAWDANRQQLYDVWKSRSGNDGKLPDLNDDILKAMIEEAGEA